jgi:hypothetical protein
MRTNRLGSKHGNIKFQLAYSYISSMVSGYGLQDQGSIPGKGKDEGVSKIFRTESITKHMLTTINTR